MYDTAIRQDRRMIFAIAEIMNALFWHYLYVKNSWVAHHVVCITAGLAIGVLLMLNLLSFRDWPIAYRHALRCDYTRSIIQEQLKADHSVRRRLRLLAVKYPRTAGYLRAGGVTAVFIACLKFWKPVNTEVNEGYSQLCPNGPENMYRHSAGLTVEDLESDDFIFSDEEFENSPAPHEEAEMRVFECRGMDDVRLRSAHY
ncbi:hypothetical protein KEM54_002801 [Ascosphaera aggregata]|nr:hypothetical protein KEM54_002801 [Ascosphaera aggregata]